MANTDRGGVPSGLTRSVKMAGSGPSSWRQDIDLRRLFGINLGLIAFAAAYFMPDMAPAVDPSGKQFVLSAEGKLALGLFALAATWWVLEVVPIGVTGIAIAVIQALFLIRDPRVAFTDYLDPAVWFIIGSIVIGHAFSKTGLTHRLAYRILRVVGERTSRIYLGVFVMTAALTLIMAHTAVAAAIYPLMLAIHHLYTDEDYSRFGKGLFIGMAYTAGAGSIITLFGAARGPVAVGFFNELVGREITFFELTWYMLPLGVVMVALLWLYIVVRYRPESPTIPGLSQRAAKLHAGLGPMKREEKLTLIITLIAVSLMSLRSMIPGLESINKSAIILAATVCFFVFHILARDDLEKIPWNIVLLFGGAMSMGFCLWRTGAAEWLAINWMNHLTHAPWLVFVIGVGAFILIMTNLIMNVAAITICLPVALVMSPYLGVAPDVVLYTALAVAGMPFLFLIGAAPNAIAYESDQFTTGEFFRSGVPASLILMVVITFFVAVVWPLMGMPVRI
ncbi:MAG: transporter [Lysobacteraceae bacterium]|nr:MAG: transporter [Xanthomonadaceae bacterium]